MKKLTHSLLDDDYVHACTHPAQTDTLQRPREKRKKERKKQLPKVKNATTN